MPIEIPIQRKDLVIDYRAREWCLMPYPDHPNGCPNFGHNPACPPQVCRIEQFVDLDRPMTLVVQEFDLAGHVAKMKRLNPNWSDRQARCVLYWQGGVKRVLRDYCSSLVAAGGTNHVYTLCPEAMGIDVIKTVKQLGIPISTRPDRTGQVFKIALVGYRKEDY